jgi:thiamine biosynthesis lipoprotein
MKILFTIALILISTEFCKAQKYQQISGPAQGTTFHITYQDKRDRDFEKEINQILQAFDLSVSTYNPNSIISQVNKNNPNVLTS